MTEATLFLAWQDPENRSWFPVGELDVDGEPPRYRFRYIHGAERARAEAGFAPLIEFPRLDGDYVSDSLFAVFRNRVIARGRPDRGEYLRALDLPDSADPIEILSVNGGRKITDAYQVFPQLRKDPDGRFDCRFFMHGWRYMPEPAQARIATLKEGEQLNLALELANPATGLAVQVQTTDRYAIGWTPCFLAEDLAAAVTEHAEYTACVVRVNPMPAPSRQRLLIELRGRWTEHEPMSGEDFQPLAG